MSSTILKPASPLSNGSSARLPPEPGNDISRFHALSFLWDFRLSKGISGVLLDFRQPTSENTRKPDSTIVAEIVAEESLGKS